MKILSHSLVLQQAVSALRPRLSATVGQTVSLLPEYSSFLDTGPLVVRERCTQTNGQKKKKKNAHFVKRPTVCQLCVLQVCANTYTMDADGERTRCSGRSLCRAQQSGGELIGHSNLLI